MFRSARNRLRPVWITFVWNCLPCFSNTKIGSVTSSFDIVQFSRSCAPQPCGWRLDYFTTEAVFCQALFLRSFWSFSNLERFVHLSVNWCFSASIGSFQGLPAELSEVILLSQRLALKYNTTPPGQLSTLFDIFFPISLRSWKRPCFSPIIIISFSWQGGGQNVLWSHPPASCVR